MSTLLRSLEFGFLLLMCGWTLGALVYALPLPRLRRALGRINATLFFADWTVFGAGSQEAVIARYQLEYRDSGAGEEGEWVSVLHGRPWAWHSFLWQPERRIADRLHRISGGFANLSDRDSPAAQRFLTYYGRRIANYVEAAHPRRPGCARQVRIIEHRSVVRAEGVSASDRVEERVVAQFSADDVVYGR